MERKMRYEMSPWSGRRVPRERIGVLSNLRSGQNRHGLDSLSLEGLVGERGMVRAFGMPGELRRIVEDFNRRGVTLMAVNGGDGTLGAVITEVFHTWRGPLPRFAPLCGGSLNSTARALGLSNGVAVADQLAEVVRALRRGGIGLQERAVRTIGVSDPNRARCAYGFLFASGLVYDYVRQIEALGRTTTWNSVLGSALLTGGALFNVGTANRIFHDVAAEVSIDGRTVEYGSFKTAIACGAILLPRVLSPFPSNLPPAERGFSFMANGMPRKELLSNLFPILRGTYQGRRHEMGYAHSLRLRCDGGYVLDGERFPQDESHCVEVKAAEPLVFLCPQGRMAS